MINVVAVTEQMETAGAIVWWHLSGSMYAESLAQAWRDAGLDEGLLPSLPSGEMALRRAINEHKEKRRMIRPLEKVNGWAIVDETANQDALDYRVECRVRIDSVGRVTIEPEDHPLAAEILAGYQRRLGELSHQDISNWLVWMTGHVNAVPLRETGGVYFVPRVTLDTWRAIAKAVRAASSHVVYEVPALNSDEAVEAVLDAVNREAQADAESLEGDLMKGTLGARALRTRATRTEELLEKLQTYEGLLGDRLDTIKTRIGTLQCNITIAILQAEAEEGEVAA